MRKNVEFGAKNRVCLGWPPLPKSLRPLRLIRYLLSAIRYPLSVIRYSIRRLKQIIPILMIQLNIECCYDITNSSLFFSTDQWKRSKFNKPRDGD